MSYDLQATMRVRSFDLIISTLFNLLIFLPSILIFFLHSTVFSPFLVLLRYLPTPPFYSLISIFTTIFTINNSLTEPSQAMMDSLRISLQDSVSLIVLLLVHFTPWMKKDMECNVWLSLTLTYIMAVALRI